MVAYVVLWKGKTDPPHCFKPEPYPIVLNHVDALAIQRAQDIKESWATHIIAEVIIPDESVGAPLAKNDLSDSPERG